MSFLDFDKVQTDYLKDTLKASHNHSMKKWLYGHMESNTYLCDGSFVAVVPDEICFVKSNGREINESTMKSFTSSNGDLHVLTDTGMSKQIIPGKKDTVRIFKDETNGEEIWINEKYLKYFEKMPVRFEGNGFRNPVKVFWSDVFVGMICPINHK